MSNPITITLPEIGSPNSTEDPKIAANFSALSAWFASPGITTSDIANDAVTNTQIASGAVQAAELDTNAVTTLKINGLAVTAEKVAASAVTTDKIEPVGVSRSKLRVFTTPSYVTVLPQTITGTATWLAAATSLIVNTTGASVPQVGQSITGTGLTSDTVITSVSGSVSPFTLGLNRVVSAAGTSITLTIAPQDTDEVYYLADATNRILWHLRYNASSSSAYKWEYVGGPGTYWESSSINPPSDNFWHLANSPAVGTPAIPLAGDYDIDLSAGLEAKSTAAGMAGVCATLTFPTKLTNASGITSSQTTMTVTNPSAISATSNAGHGGNAFIDTNSTGLEVVNVTGVAGSTVTMTRGTTGTTGTAAATHALNAPVYSIPYAPATTTSASYDTTGLAVYSYVSAGVPACGGGTRKYRFNALEASTTQVPIIAYRMFAGADSAFILDAITTVRPVRVG